MEEIMKDTAYPFSQPKISIITPSYNQGQYIEETINSVISQQYTNYELIIIDGGSTDSTLDVIRRYDSHITYWVSEPDRGQSHAIRKGLELATGDIINWINSDDIVAPGAFHRIAKEFDLEKYDVLCGYCDYFVDDLHHLDKRNERMGIGSTVGDTLLAVHMNQPSTFFKASIFKELGIDEQFRYTMDVDLWFRYLLLAGHSRVKLSEDLLTYFRLHSQSKTVAEGNHFMGDIYKVFYNILFSLNQFSSSLSFISEKIPDFKNFKPTIYPIRIPPTELKKFVRHFAWLSVVYYNEMHNHDAARKSLSVALKHGQQLNLTVVKQMIKHYFVPKKALR